MANLVEGIRESLPDGCFATGRLRKQGCSVSLAGAPMPSIAIDMDKPQAPVKQSETKCDYIFIGGSSNVFLVPLELKRGKLDASDTLKQLQAGANIAAARIIPKREGVQFLPVAVCGGKFHRAEIRRLSQRKIRFRRQSSNVQLLRCGQRLADALPKRR